MFFGSVRGLMGGRKSIRVCMDRCKWRVVL